MESDPLLPQLLLQAVLIAINALFASTEIAVISLNETKLRRQMEAGDKKAAAMLKMVEQPTSFLSAIQICITLAGFLGSAFAADNFSDKLTLWLTTDIGFTAMSPTAIDTVSVIVITLVLSYFTLVLGELVPKRVAMKNPEGIARAVCRLILGISAVLKPVIWLLTVSTNGVLRLCGIDPRDTAEEVSEEEILMMLDEGEESGNIEAEETKLIKNVFALNDICAEDIMVHRSLVTVLWRDDSPEKTLAAITESGYSRFPVCGDNVDDIVGILYAKKYLNAPCGGNISEYCMKPKFVHSKTYINSILLDMQREHMHMAVVVDDYGGVVGIITLEDILEELVGEIFDESDEIVEQIETLQDGSYKVLCTAELKRLEELAGCELSSEADTVSGWVVEKLGGIPKCGASFNDGGLHVEVTATDSRRVLEITVSIDNKEEVR